MITTLAGAAGAIHLAAGAAIAGALARRPAPTRHEPFISIVVPARNEAQNLPRLFSSLRKLRYPSDKIELIVVNDDSTDNTAEIANNLGRSLPFDLRVIHADHGASETLPRTKTLPLAQGIEAARGEVVLMTDGDCAVPRDWARDMVAHFSDDVGLVCGITLPDYDASPDFMTKLEAVDWALLLGVCAGMSRLHTPLALVGNNYAVRRTAYFDVGTFRSIAHNRIDDIALFKAIADSKRWHVAFAVTPGASVTTLPVSRAGAIVHQRYRWMEGFGAVSARGKLLFGFGVATHLLWPLALLLSWPLGLLIVLSILVGDWVVIATTLARLGRRRLGLAALCYPVFACFYGWGLIASLLRRPEVTWKERKFA
ncbi:MAG: glycosyltransferase [bacterium]|nr:glycosyltransferase [bacterium]